MNGIAMLCYILIAPGVYDWVAGHETRALKAGKFGQERALFVPNEAKMRAVAVETNDCRYLENPELAMLRELEAMKVDAIKVGDRQWCHVDGWGRQTCTYDTPEQCMKKVKRGEYCEQNADYSKKEK